jgi:tetraacyldisaccharide 4'-kinase
MTPQNEDVRFHRREGGEIVERAPVYSWARRAVYGGGGVPGRLARGALTPLAWAWGAAAERRLRPDPKLGRSRLLPAPAISVGNVTVGGGGKTSLVEWIVRSGAPRGAAVAVLSRGYGRTANVARALPPGHGPAPVEEVGDEPALMARAGAWVGVSADRFMAARAVTQLGARPDLFVLDDGLQHRSVPRALDLVVFAAADLEAPARCIPSGPLRQRSSWHPPSAAWVVTGIDPREREWPSGSIGRAYSAWWCELRGTPADWVAASTVSLKSWREGGESPFDPGGRPLVALAGVARPESVGPFARQAGLDVASIIVFPDHHPYRAADILSLRASHPEGSFLMTEKDAVKCDPTWFGEAPVGVLRRRMEPRDPGLLAREIAEAIAWGP